MKPHWRKYNKNEKYPHLAGWEPAAAELPDVWIEPRKLFTQILYFLPFRSKILEIKASSINETVKFKAGYTLRFPRVIRIRDDKNWNECLTFAGKKHFNFHLPARTQETSDNGLT